jgi:phosphoglycolate phosphatase-like HAD superfamily hydrolase
VQAVVFDLDGVLVDSEHLWDEVRRGLAARAGRPWPEDAAARTRVRLVFDARPGPGLVVGMTDVGDRFRFVANVIEVVPPNAPLPNLPVARAVWKPRPSLGTSAACWLTALPGGR